IGATIVAGGLAMAALRTDSKAFLIIFAVLAALGLVGFVVSEVLHWIKTSSSTWWTLGAVVVFAGATMLLGSVHHRARTPRPPL
ncbi:MAG: hypothetical protein ACRDZ8_21675, partial [Acidimicrobiales bacterium]